MTEQLSIPPGHQREKVEMKAGDVNCEMKEDDLRANPEWKNRELDSRELVG